MVGDATRGSLLTSDLPASDIVSSVALDRGLFMLSGLMVTNHAGFLAVVFVPAVPRGLRVAASISAVVLLLLLAAVWLFGKATPMLLRAGSRSGSAALVETLAAA